MKRLWQRVQHLLTGIRRTMKKHLPLLDRLLPRKRSSIKTLLAKLRSGMGLEHSHHRSPINAFVQLLILPGRLLPGATQDQYGHSPHP